MKGFVLTRWTRMFVWMVSMSIIWRLLAPAGLLPTGLAWISALAFIAMVALRAAGAVSRPMNQVVDDNEAEPEMVAAAMPVSRPVIPLKGQVNR